MRHFIALIIVAMSIVVSAGSEAFAAEHNTTEQQMAEELVESYQEFISNDFSYEEKVAYASILNNILVVCEQGDKSLKNAKMFDEIGRNSKFSTHQMDDIDAEIMKVNSLLVKISDSISTDQEYDFGLTRVLTYLQEDLCALIGMWNGLAHI